jgi:hypothetical protein
MEDVFRILESRVELSNATKRIIPPRWPRGGRDDIMRSMSSLMSLTSKESSLNPVKLAHSRTGWARRPRMLTIPVYENQYRREKTDRYLLTTRLSWTIRAGMPSSYLDVPAAGSTSSSALSNTSSFTLVNSASADNDAESSFSQEVRSLHYYVHSF